MLFNHETTIINIPLKYKVGHKCEISYRVQLVMHFTKLPHLFSLTTMCICFAIYSMDLRISRH